MRWTDDKVEELTKLVEAGELSYALIADKLGCTRNAAIGKAKRLGLSNPVGVTKKTKPREPSMGVAQPAKTAMFNYRKQTKASIEPLPELIRKNKRVRLPDELKSEKAFEKHMTYLDDLTIERGDITDIPGPLGCKWITGDVKQPGAYWCRKPVKQGSCWCPKHHTLAYAPASAYHGRNVPKRLTQKGK